MTWKIAALYKFVDIKDTQSLQVKIRDFCLERGVVGTLLLAPEGVNGTIASHPKYMEEVISFLDQHLNITKGELKFSHAENTPFRRLKVRLKKEIITMKQPHIDPVNHVGEYVEAKAWNAIISDPDVVTLDTRNDYETQVGMFKGAIDPNTKTFTEFADYVRQNLDPKKHKKVAMYCTGGIRCEKASSFMLAEGFETVYHLKGGILKYLENIKREDSLWDGSCFVFDRRVAVEHGLEESPHLLCYGCRYPLEPEDLKRDEYEAGVTCHQCVNILTDEQKRSFRMRHQQIHDAQNNMSKKQKEA